MRLAHKQSVVVNEKIREEMKGQKQSVRWLSYSPRVYKNIDGKIERGDAF